MPFCCQERTVRLKFFIFLFYHVSGPPPAVFGSFPQIFVLCSTHITIIRIFRKNFIVKTFMQVIYITRWLN